MFAHLAMPAAIRTIKSAAESIGDKTDDLTLNIKGISLSTMEQRHKILARISNESYNPVYNRASFGEYKYKQDKSSVMYAVYINDNTKQIIIGIRGTKNKRDLFKDINLTIGLLPSTIFKRTVDNIRILINKLPSYKIILTGHSLGASKVLFVAPILKLTGVVFNPFIPRLDSAGLELVRGSSRVIKYTIIGDILSNSIISVKSARPSIRVIKVRGLGILNKHAINSFI